MNRSTLFLIGLLVVLGVIAYFILPSSEERETSYKPAEIDLKIDSSAVIKMDIQKNLKSITIENVGGKWTMTSPINVLADEEGVKRIISGIIRFKIGSLVSSNPEKQSVFQVDTNGTKFTLTERNGKSLSLILGKMGPSYSEIYFRIPGSKDVYLGEGIDSWSINKDVKEWRDKIIMNTPSELIKDLIYVFGSREYSFHHDSSGWQSDGITVDANIISPVLNSLTNLRADDFVDTAINLQTNPVTLKIRGQVEKDLSFYPKTSDSSQYIVSSSSTPQLFVIGKWVVQQVLKPVEQQPVSVKPIAVSPVNKAKPEIKLQKKVTSKKAAVEKPVAKKEKVVKTEKPVVQKKTELPPKPPVDVTPKEIQPKKEEVKKSKADTYEDEGDLTVHTVKKGETMQTIAKMYNVTVEQILKWNLLTSISIKPGQELYIYIKK